MAAKQLLILHVSSAGEAGEGEGARTPKVRAPFLSRVHAMTRGRAAGDASAERFSAGDAVTLQGQNNTKHQESVSRKKKHGDTEEVVPTHP